jgi:hypothetical protein
MVYGAGSLEPAAGAWPSITGDTRSIQPNKTKKKKKKKKGNQVRAASTIAVSSEVRGENPGKASSKLLGPYQRND